MYIKNRLASMIYKADILVLAVFGVAVELREFGWQALRLLPVVGGILVVGYYLATLILATKDKAFPISQPLCPALKGAITIAMIIGAVATTAFDPGVDLVDAAALLGLIVPLLMLGDWLLFDQKGLLKLSAPFNFLALVASYFAIMIITSEQLTSSAVLRYPYEFLNFHKHMNETVVGLSLIALVTLAFGFAYTLADKLLCGEEVTRSKRAASQAETVSAEVVISTNEEDEDDVGAESPTKPVKSEESSPDLQPVSATKSSTEPSQPSAELNFGVSADVTDDNENDWDRDSYVIKLPEKAPLAPVEGANDANSMSVSSKAASKSSVAVLEEMVAKLETKTISETQPQPVAKSQTQSKPRKKMDFAVQKPQAGQNRPTATAKPITKKKKKHSNGAPANRRRQPKFEDIVRTERHKSGN